MTCQCKIELWEIRAFHGRGADTYTCVDQVIKVANATAVPTNPTKPSLPAAAAFTASSEKISASLPEVPISTS